MIHRHPGRLIVFEGIDGSGKSTQARILAEHLEAAGYPTVLTKEPTDGHFGHILRESAKTGRRSPEEELELFLADRRCHVRDVIMPALARGAVVVVDRYYFSTAAHQGARGLDPGAILRTNEAFAPQPDLLFALDVPVDVGLARISARGAGDLFERREDLEKVAAIFAGFDLPYLVRIDGMQDEAWISRLIRWAALRMLRGRLGDTPGECPQCSGRGELRMAFDRGFSFLEAPSKIEARWVTCPACGGSGL